MNYIANPYAFWLLLLPIAIRILIPAAKGMHGDALRVPFLKDLVNINLQSGGLWGMSIKNGILQSNKNNLRFALLYVIFALLVIAFARPQLVGEPIRVKNYSHDILMVMDISTSMLEPDFAVNNQRVDRLTAVKIAAGQFIDKRANDRIGLVLFGTRAYLQAPITFDKKSVKEVLFTMEAGMAGNSTSIGDAMGLALKSLKDSPDKDKKVIILLTDGENNDGALTVPQTLSLAKQEGIKIYTIGVGSENMFNALLTKVGFNSGLDEDSLKLIANETKANYFRAKSTSSLQKIYNEIDRLEPTSNEDNYIRETKELFYIPLLAAAFLTMLLAMMIRRGG